LQDYEEGVNTKYIRNMQTNSAVCMEIIESLEEKLKSYKAVLDNRSCLEAARHDFSGPSGTK
jgi:hypothetical protein